MNMNWIDDVLRLNTRIVAAQAVVSAQGDRILEMLEAGEYTAKAEELHKAYQNDLRRLRALRDTILNEIKDGV